MATIVMSPCDSVYRDVRSIWLGHVISTGLRTNDRHEIFDVGYLVKPRLATDMVLQLPHDRYCNSLSAVECN